MAEKEIPKENIPEYKPEIWRFDDSDFCDAHVKDYEFLEANPLIRLQAFNTAYIQKLKNEGMELDELIKTVADIGKLFARLIFRF